MTVLILFTLAVNKNMDDRCFGLLTKQWRPYGRYCGLGTWFCHQNTDVASVGDAQWRWFHDRNTSFAPQASTPTGYCFFYVTLKNIQRQCGSTRPYWAPFWGRWTQDVLVGVRFHRVLAPQCRSRGSIILGFINRRNKINKFTQFWNIQLINFLG